MTRIVESICSISKSRRDRLMVTDIRHFKLVRVIALDTKTPENPFGLDVDGIKVEPLAAGSNNTGLFGALLPPPTENARETVYEIRWSLPGVEGGVVFEVDR